MRYGISSLYGLLIVAWYGGKLYFYEVKRSGRHVEDAQRLVEVARE